MSEHTADDIQKHIRVYLTVFFALAFLTVMTVLASYMHVSTTAHITIALVIAAIKASLVAGYFMHLISEQQVIYWILALCAVFFLALLFLPVLIGTEQVVLGNNLISGPAE